MKSTAEADRHYSTVLPDASRGDTSIAMPDTRSVRSAEGQGGTAREALPIRLRRQEPSGSRDWSRDELYEH